MEELSQALGKPPVRQLPLRLWATLGKRKQRRLSSWRKKQERADGDNPARSACLQWLLRRPRYRRQETCPAAPFLVGSRRRLCWSSPHGTPDHLEHYQRLAAPRSAGVGLSPVGSNCGGGLATSARRGSEGGVAPSDCRVRSGSVSSLDLGASGIPYP